MNLQELKDFRSKLKYAKFLCALHGYNTYITFAFSDAGLIGQCADAFVCFIPPDVYNWYLDPTRTLTERKAMFDNSIAAIDVRIAKTK